ncbi:MAG: ferrous iron transport protein A [Clostridia bacterium]|nr:ferrous iron transport protein A [Clostridia bacterium]
MLPLSCAQAGEEHTVKKVGGKPEVKQHLKDLGFVEGTNIRVVSVLAGSQIIEVKNVRIALNRDLAAKIMI